LVYLFQQGLAGLLALSLVVLPPPARAFDTVYDPSNFAKNAMTAARALQSNINEATQIQNQLQQIAMEVKNLTRFPTGVWGDIQSELNQLTQLAQSSGAISYAMQNLSAQFHQRYPGYQAPADYQQEYQQWTTNALDGIRTALEAANQQNNQFAEENGNMQRIKAESDSAVGQMQALQAGNMLAAQLVQQLQKLRELQMAEMQAQTAYMATQIQEQATEKAALKAWLDSGRNYKPVN
jgi:P-type conjugative transfer protein TrbJ